MASVPDVAASSEPTPQSPSVSDPRQSRHCSCRTHEDSHRCLVPAPPGWKNETGCSSPPRSALDGRRMGVVLARAMPPPGLPVLRPSPSSACRRHSPGGTGRCSRRSLPNPCQPSPYDRRVGFRITRLKACPAFTRVTARRVAESPSRPVSSECFSPCRYLHRPLRLRPAGATVAGRDSHPPGDGALHGALQLTGDRAYLAIGIMHLVSMLGFHA